MANSDAPDDEGDLVSWWPSATGGKIATWGFLAFFVFWLFSRSSDALRLLRHDGLPETWSWSNLVAFGYTVFPVVMSAALLVGLTVHAWHRWRRRRAMDQIVEDGGKTSEEVVMEFDVPDEETLPEREEVEDSIERG